MADFIDMYGNWQNFTNHTDIDFSLLSNISNNTNIAGTDIILGFIFIILSMLLITRDVEKWKILAFPLAIGFTVAGINISPVIVIITAIIFTIEGLSLQVIASLVDTISDKTMSLINTTRRNAIEIKDKNRDKQRERKRTNLAKDFNKYCRIMSI